MPIGDSLVEAPPDLALPLASAVTRDQDQHTSSGALVLSSIFIEIGGCMADNTVRGRFVWHELRTPNPAGSVEFYAKAVGWAEQPGAPDPSYLMLAAPSGPIGGAVEHRAGTPQWLPYIGTTDVDATVEAAERLGAKVETQPTALPNGGRYAVLTDPQGATFGIHASSDAATAEKTPGAGEFSWHELATNVSPNIAFAFYAALFDWDEISEHDMGPMGMYLVFGRNGRQLGGMFDKGSAGKPGSAYWLGYVSVTDLEETIERATGARGSVLAGPMDVPGGDRIAQLMDPHGAFFALHRAATARMAPEQPAATRRKAAKPAAPAQRSAAKPKKTAKAAPAKKPSARKATPKKRPAKKAAAKKKPAARKAAKKKSPAKKASPRKASKKTKRKAKTRKRGR
jgi:predicted enzyme related to lactoylglutathione lyase